MLGEQFLNAVGLFIVSREKVIFLQKKNFLKTTLEIFENISLLAN